MARVIGAMLRVLLVAVVLLAAATVWVSGPRRNRPAADIATLLPQPPALPAVHLTDQRGLDFATSDLMGNYSLMFFGFTRCPDICPPQADSIAIFSAPHDATVIATDYLRGRQRYLTQRTSVSASS